jgi:hypothetical protein
MEGKLSINNVSRIIIPAPKKILVSAPVLKAIISGKAVLIKKR